MSVTDDDRQPDDSIRGPAGPRWTRRRAAVGAIGLAAVLGGGAYLITDRVLAEQNSTASHEGGISAVTAGPAPDLPGPPLAPSTTATRKAAPSPSASLAPDIAKKIAEARRKMIEDGVSVKRPLQPPSGVKAADVRATTKGSLKEGGVVRIVTARGDLTGQRELGWVSGGITKHRNVPCSSTVRFSSDVAPQKKPNLLICWRTSAKKSVISIVVDPKGHPSAEKAVGALEAKWRSMG